MLSWTCIGSGKFGLYTNYYRHRDGCNYCTPEYEEERRQKMEERQLAIRDHFQSLDDKQRPWSEWGRSEASCLQHTGHGIDQVQQLYSMCEQSLLNYCSHWNEQHSDSIITSYLSPMNLLVVTLWYLKHYHSEPYISTEVNLAQKTVSYFLSSVLDILHSCVYPELISLPADIANRRTPHGPERSHKLIVDFTFIAISESSASEERKAYYHAKSSTNYALEVQIACDFHHRIVHVPECYHGSVHDITIFRESGLLERVNDAVQIIVDKGYICEENVVTPKKKLINV